VISADTANLDLQEEWSEADPSERFRSAFPLHRGAGTAHSTVVYFELDPGGAVSTHADSVEEILLVLDGAVRVELDGERGVLAAGAMAVVPAGVPHAVHNDGEVPARCVGFFAGGRVVSTFEHALVPSGMREFDTAAL
jgi:quercetin dioxygenase-like cupin family protein